MGAENERQSEGFGPNNMPCDTVSDWSRKRVELYISNIEDPLNPAAFTRQRLPQTTKILREPLLTFAQEPLLPAFPIWICLQGRQWHFG
jgi:hypothetical protein